MLSLNLYWFPIKKKRHSPCGERHRMALKSLCSTVEFTCKLNNTIVKQTCVKNNLIYFKIIFIELCNMDFIVNGRQSFDYK